MSRSQEGGGQIFCDNNTMALVIKSVQMWEGGLKIILPCVTSFMDDPLVQLYVSIDGIIYENVPDLIIFFC